MKKLVSLTLTVIMLISISMPYYAYATDLHPSDITLTQEQLNNNAYSYIENALKYAKNNAYDGSPVTITLPSGKYNLSKCLHIYSNTNLVLQEDTTLVKTFEDGNMLKCGLQEEKNYGYDGYKNITVSGGIWNENYCGTSCAMRFAHCENVTVKDLTIKKNKNSHHMEIAAAKDFKVTNCTFTGYKRTNSGDGMALQIDTMHNTSHFPSYYYYDDTPCKNVTVSGCTFESVYSGVGSFSGVIGSYFDNIKIVNNTFTNIKDKAIAAFNFINSSISNNKIDSATIGIIFEYYPFEKLTSRLNMPNSSAAKTDIIQNCNSKIKGNTVAVSRNISRNTSAGIAVFGGILSKSDAKTYGLKQGNYLVKNLIISKNTVNVRSAKSVGMKLCYIYNSFVKNNTIRAINNTDGGYNGITFVHSQQNEINSNIINKFDNSLAFQTRSKKNVLKENTLKNAKKFGVAVDSTSSVSVSYNNKFSKNGEGYVHIRKKNYKPNPNAVTDLKKDNNTITWTALKKCSGYKVYRSTKKTVGFVEIATVKGKKKTTFTDTTAESGKKYFYRIAAYRGYKNSTIYGKRSEYIKVKY